MVGGGGGVLWLGWWVGVSEVRAPERKPQKGTVFFRFLGGQAPYDPILRLLFTLTSRPVFFEAWDPKPQKNNNLLVFLEVGFSTSP